MSWEGPPPQPGGDTSAARRGSDAAAGRRSDTIAVAWNRPHVQPEKEREALVRN